MDAFQVGCFFASSEEFSEKLKRMEQESKCCFSFKNSTLSTSDNKSRKRPIPDKFSHSRGTVVCTHFGEKREVPSTGVKTKTRTQKLNCGASFSFKYDDFSQGLVITKSQLVHNHAATEATYMNERKMKKLSEHERSTLKNIVSLEPANKQLRIMINKEFQKSLSLDDVRRLKSKLKSEQHGRSVDAVFEQLSNMESTCSVRTVMSGTNDLLLDMICFSTKEMISLFQSFPEVLFLDGTYKKNSCGFPLYQMMVEDCSGQARPVFYAFVRIENAELLKMMLEMFVDIMGDSARSVKVVMTDKCKAEMAACKEAMPWAQNLLCHWHMHTAFEKKVKSLRLGREEKNKLTLLHMSLRKTADAEAFLRLEEEMGDKYPAFSQYYQQNWAPLKTLWSSVERASVVTFLNDTNNFVESENRRLGQLLNSNTSLASALKRLVSHADFHYSEVQTAIIQAQMSRTTHHNALQQCKSTYDLFMPQAVTMMLEEHKDLATVQVLYDDSLGCFFVSDPGTDTRAKIVLSDGYAVCHCPFYRQTTLPCVHLMAIQTSTVTGPPCNIIQPTNRWLKKSAVSDPQHSATGGSILLREIIPAERRHHRTEALLLQLSAMLKGVGGRQFEEREAVLQTVVAMWAAGQKVQVSEGGAETGEGEVIGVGPEGGEVSVQVEGTEVVSGEAEGTEVVSGEAEGTEVVSGEAGHSGGVSGEAGHSGGVSGEAGHSGGVSGEAGHSGGVSGEAGHSGGVSGEAGHSGGVSGEAGHSGGVSGEAGQVVRVFIPNVRARGRPKQLKTRKNCPKKARRININENICYQCLEEEVNRLSSDGSGFDLWTRCSLCVRWFHNACLAENHRNATDFICKYH